MENDKLRSTFIDLFAGCGGLSLGLAQAGLTGLFAVEKSRDAFATFEANLLDGPENIRFQWPVWLERQAHEIRKLLTSRRKQLKAMAGKIDVVAGGPPCQGFSFAGRRRKNDARNTLFRKYVDLVALLRPRVVIIENVPGMRVAHGTGPARGAASSKSRAVSYYDRLLKRLGDLGYEADGKLFVSADFGVPQLRPRLVIIGLRRDVAARIPNAIHQTFELVEASRKSMLVDLGIHSHVTAEEAISDLEAETQETVQCPDPPYPGRYQMVRYARPRTAYQELMHRGMATDANMDSMRLAQHRPYVRKRYEHILKNCRKGVGLSDLDRAELGITKHRICPMKPNEPSPTLTTLPDDLLHYSEPRILTVRETARLQSFPDWFVFRGQYTTGGTRRRTECPRYTQVANAVPPLMAKAIGAGVVCLLEQLDSETRRNNRDAANRRVVRSRRSPSQVST
ncbi:MAG: DNA cytosine methyltransferase [Burkholderiales bacterium]